MLFGKRCQSALRYNISEAFDSVVTGVHAHEKGGLIVNGLRVVLQMGAVGRAHLDERGS